MAMSSLKILRQLLVAALFSFGGFATAQYESNESSDIEYEADEGYHEEEWYDPSDWFDDEPGVSYESDWDDYDYGYDNGYDYDYDYGYGDDAYDYGYDDYDYGYDDEYGYNYYTDDWYDDEGLYNGWYY